MKAEWIKGMRNGFKLGSQGSLLKRSSLGDKFYFFCWSLFPLSIPNLTFLDQKFKKNTNDFKILISHSELRFQWKS